MSEINLDIERQTQARRYARLQRRWMAVDLILGGVYLLAWLLSGGSILLKETISRYSSNDWVLVAVFGAVFGGTYLLLSLPIGFYTGYILPHQFGQSNQSLKGWVGDQVKSLILGGILGGLLLEIVYAILRASPTWWWLWTAIVMLLFSVVLANLAPILIFPLFYKFVPLGQEHADLEQRLVLLAQNARTKVRGVYKFDMSRRTKSANAALTGLGNSRRIILGDTLIDEFTPDEIETVLAHELGHHVHRDIPLGVAIETILTLVGLYLASIGLSAGTAALGFEGPADVAALPLFAIVMAVYGLLTMPLGNAFSRWREWLADQYALKVTGKPAAFASAMTRLANQNLAEVDPEPWVEWLLYSHPALSKRIAAAQAFPE